MHGTGAEAILRIWKRKTQVRVGSSRLIQKGSFKLFFFDKNYAGQVPTGRSIISIGGISRTRVNL